MRRPQVEGHWHSLIEGFATSSLDFYELIKANVGRREIPNLKISEVEWKESGLGSGKRVYLRVSREGLNFDICAAPFGTGYFFSWWLARIPRVLLDFAFIFGCFCTWWLIALILLSGNREGHGCGVVFAPFVLLALILALGFLVRHGESGLETTVLSMPITGFCYGFVFRPQTYFNEDTALMFRESVHAAVTEAIDQVTTAQGMRALSDEERRLPGLRPAAPGQQPHPR